MNPVEEALPLLLEPKLPKPKLLPVPVPVPPE
jgi:hypothetical protein